VRGRPFLSKKTEADGALETAVKFVDLIKETIKKENPQAHFKF
jgi:hypothetical protein